MALNKVELANRVQARVGGTKKAAREYTEALLDEIVAAVEEHEGVDLSGIMKIEVREKNARTARNPQTGETVEVPAGFKVHIKPMARLRRAVQEA